MAVRFTTFRKINKNRFRKIYPINHYAPVDGFLTDKQLVVETKLVDFNNSSFEFTTLDGDYSETPVIIVSGFNESSSAQANVNLYIDSIETIDGKIKIGIRSSDNFTGKAALQVLEVV